VKESSTLRFCDKNPVHVSLSASLSVTPRAGRNSPQVTERKFTELPQDAYSGSLSCL